MSGPAVCEVILTELARAECVRRMGHPIAEPKQFISRTNALRKYVHGLFRTSRQ